MSINLKNTLLSVLRSFFRLFYFCLFLLIKFFIAVGEMTTFILLLPFRMITLVIQEIYRLLDKLLLSRVSANQEYYIENANKLKNWLLKTHKRVSSKGAKLLRKFPSLQSIYQSLLFTLSKIILILEVVYHSASKNINKTLNVVRKMVSFPFYVLKLSVSARFRYFYIGFVMCLLVIFFFQSYLFIKKLPSPQNIGKTNYPLSTHIFDRNGRLLYEIYREQNRTPIKLKDLPVFVSQASIAIEDKDFYHHNGISFVGGILRAIKDTWKNNELQGGSTITQQLIKSALLTPERTIERKIKEVILAVWAERLYTKNQILEMYFNQVPYGGSAYGIGEAAKTYFGHDATQLTIGEAAMLAGLTRAPSVYSPYIDPKQAQSRRNEVLRKMFELNFITKNQYSQAIKEKLNVVSPNTNIHAPHFVFYTKALLEDNYGIKQVEEGGLKVVTTLDLSIQQEAEKILKEELDKIAHMNVTNGGIIVTRPDTGEILAMVGSKDYFSNPSGAYNVTTALRQPGSSLKPLLYSLALERGYTASSVIDDSPIIFSFEGSERYQPVNYDGKFHGQVTLRSALANSFNIPAVKVLNTLGVDNYILHAQKMGITTWNDLSRFGLSLALGGGEVKMVDEAVAFGVLANNGDRIDLTPIKTLIDKDSNVLEGLQPSPKNALNKGIAYIISDILADNNARQLEFGVHSALEIPGYKVAVKTGTTDSKRDNWTTGYTPEFVVVVWVGNNDNTPMNQYLASGITGAAPIWNKMMTYLLTNNANKNTVFSQPENVVQKQCFGKKEFFLIGTENSSFCRPTIIRPQNLNEAITQTPLPSIEIKVVTPTRTAREST